MIISRTAIRYALIMGVALLASCKTHHFVVSDGPTARKLMLYNQSIEFLMKEFNAERDPLKQQKIALNIADSYAHFNDYADAEKWYRKCLDLNGEAPALLGLGMMQKQQEKYAEAMKTFDQYQRATNAGFEGRKQAIQSQDAMEWKAAQTKIQVTNVEIINTPSSDYELVPFKQGKYVLSSSREEATGANRDGWTGEKFDDLFVTEKKDGRFSTPVGFGAPVNTDGHESSATFSKDFKEMYFVRCKDDQQKSNQYCHVYYTAFNNEHWDEPVKLDLFPDTVNVYDPYLSRDGKLLLVAADMPGGFGSTDIYIIPKVDTGWGTPLNLGGAINTPGSERTPWLDEKGNLYFSSNGLPGMGGLDVFKATRSKNSFKDPVNLRAPINSGADDFGYWIEKYKPVNNNDTILSLGYFSSNRPGGKGKDDIYQFEDKWINYFILNGTVVERKYENPMDPDSKVLGLKGLPHAKVDLKTPDDRMIGSTVTDTFGNYTFKLDAETSYKLSATKTGYFSKNDFISTKGMRNKDSIYIHVYSQIELEKIFPEKMIVIPNIYYDYDKATLRPESKLVLDSILVFFKENPDLTIEIGSHTDSRGSDEYNNKLSQERAQSVVDYLVEKKIPLDRLIAKGYGKTMLINNCGTGVPCTEEEHQKNRRTTFRVVSAKLNLESIQPADIKTVPKPDNK